jgi:hypothetical protein
VICPHLPGKCRGWMDIFYKKESKTLGLIGIKINLIYYKYLGRSLGSPGCPIDILSI